MEFLQMTFQEILEHLTAKISNQQVPVKKIETSGDFSNRFSEPSNKDLSGNFGAASNGDFSQKFGEPSAIRGLSGNFGAPSNEDFNHRFGEPSTSK